MLSCNGLIKIRGARVPAHYPVPAGYCTARHCPDQARYFFKIWSDPGNMARFFCVSVTRNVQKQSENLTSVRIRFSALWRRVIDMLFAVSREGESTARCLISRLTPRTTSIDRMIKRFTQRNTLLFL